MDQEIPVTLDQTETPATTEMAQLTGMPETLGLTETQAAQALVEVQETPAMPHQATGQERQETQADPVTRAGRQATRTKV